MKNRRDFLKKAGLGGIAMAGMSATAMNHLTNLHGEPLQTDGNTLKGNGKEVKIKVTAPLFCPYYSINKPEQKGGNAYYYWSESFTHNPFTLPASGMSGSPVIMDAKGKFIGFMTTLGFENSTYSFDGKETLTVSVPEGQEIFLDESGNGDESWKAYNRIMMKRLNVTPLKQTPKFWTDVEYCTWSEQKMLSTKRQEHFHLLTHDFVKYYIEKINEFGYPKGKLTLDHGWGTFPDGSINSGYGSWIPDPKKFPDFRKTMDMINENGFTPGLWIGFPKIHKNSLAAKNYPELLGNFKQGTTPDRKDDIQWINSQADIYEYASEVISRFHTMGVMKFKIDMSYNTKSDMLPIHKALYKAAKDIDKNIEMEFHVPDIFFTKYADVVRTNDIWLLDKYNWQGRVKTHYEICYKSAPGRGINLDHIGGNSTEAITEKKFLEHLEMYKDKKGYPLVSVLPHHFGKKCVEKTGEYLWDYERGPKTILSDFY
ncbi:alpha-galactosidase [Flavicella sediminum]|uniref:alpha-galactosidase n=1 Tax=Flavicella sediminum TaxID=2585141 RepID=UPI00111FD5B0|nr:twin-arginine translocation signal domain-containing protein [Flavicella sediminum]